MATVLPVTGIRPRFVPPLAGKPVPVLPHPSPNFGPRREGLTPELIVIHYTAMQSAEAALARLCDPQYEVSAHYLIAEDGRCFQMVPEADRAWHAGAGEWGGRGDVNSRSIGIELANTGAQPFSEPQMHCLEILLKGVMARWDVGPAGVLGHSDFAPTRKFDPGARFDWRRLALQGLAIWSDAQACSGPVTSARFGAAVHRLGYPIEQAAADLLLSAFRLRFAPWRKGALCAADLAVAQDLARRYPVDAPSVLT